MADALTKISFPPSRPLCSSSSNPLNSPRLSLKSPSFLSSDSMAEELSLVLLMASSGTLFSLHDLRPYPMFSVFLLGNSLDHLSVQDPKWKNSIYKSGFRFPKAQKWWEKGLHPNMKEVTSAQDLVDSLLNAGDKLVIVDFFSPGCGGCKPLHPKICQFAEMNPNIQFLQVNYEEHKSMCYSLGVHVLPFFRFYRGAHGRLCSFSCTIATIKKFKDALAKHNTDRCSLGPAQGLEEKDLLALAANKELSFNYTPKPAEEVTNPNPLPAHVGGVEISEPERSRPDLEHLPLPLPSKILKSAQTSKENSYVG